MQSVVGMAFFGEADFLSVVSVFSVQDLAQALGLGVGVLGRGESDLWGRHRIAQPSILTDHSH